MGRTLAAAQVHETDNISTTFKTCKTSKTYGRLAA